MTKNIPTQANLKHKNKLMKIARKQSIKSTFIRYKIYPKNNHINIKIQTHRVKWKQIETTNKFLRTLKDIQTSITQEVALAT